MTLPLLTKTLKDKTPRRQIDNAFKYYTCIDDTCYTLSLRITKAGWMLSIFYHLVSIKCKFSPICKYATISTVSFTGVQGLESLHGMCGAMTRRHKGGYENGFPLARIAVGVNLNSYVLCILQKIRLSMCIHCSLLCCLLSFQQGVLTAESTRAMILLFKCKYWEMLTILTSIT